PESLGMRRYGSCGESFPSTVRRQIFEEFGLEVQPNVFLKIMLPGRPKAQPVPRKVSRRSVRAALNLEHILEPPSCSRGSPESRPPLLAADIGFFENRNPRLGTM